MVLAAVMATVPRARSRWAVGYHICILVEIRTRPNIAPCKVCRGRHFTIGDRGDLKELALILS
jgi:hypothetical protein